MVKRSRQAGRLSLTSEEENREIVKINERNPFKIALDTATDMEMSKQSE